MSNNRTQMLASMPTRQKVTAVIFIIILFFLIWQIIGLLKGPSAPPIKPSAGNVKKISGTPPSNQNLPQQPLPQVAPVPKQPQALSQREAQLLQLQQETEAKYVAALGELQMLKISQQIAETNKAIVAAKLETLTAEKNIVDLLKPPAPVVDNYAQGLVTPANAVPQKPIEPVAQTLPSDVSYQVISVSQLQYQWGAVLGFQGRLYNVSVGDILPPDQSKVISINRTGVTLEKNGNKRKISLVPLI